MELLDLENLWPHTEGTHHMVNNSFGSIHLNHDPFLLFSKKREDTRMVDHQTIAELVGQIPVDTWNVLREIKQRRPAMMLPN
jgi:hypothetical protein